MMATLDAAEDIAGAGMGKKFGLGFLCGLSAILAMKGSGGSTEHYIKAYVL